MPQKTLRSERPAGQARRKRATQPQNVAGVAAFLTEDGGVFEVADAGNDLGRMTAQASESSLARLWGAMEYDETCRIFREGT